jgi:hypothetical protein
MLLCATTTTATCGTLRLRPLKIGAIVRFSVRDIKIAMASASKSNVIVPCQ